MTIPGRDPAGRRGLTLAFGLRFEDLHHRDGLARIDGHFLAWLDEHDAGLAGRLRDARATLPSAADEATLLLALAPFVDAFIARLFDIEDEVLALRSAHDALAPLIRAKWKFVKRKALLDLTPADVEGFDADAARAEIEGWLGGPFEELAFSKAVLGWQADAGAKPGTPTTLPPDEARRRVETARLYSAWAVLTDAGQALHGRGVLFRHPRKVEPAALLNHTRERDEQGVRIHLIRPESIRRREGFALTDHGPSLRDAIDQASYCLLCHHQGKDSCSKGMRAASEHGAPAFRTDVFGTRLAGCPLEERISEFHEIKAKGHAIAALATITVDNPMVAGTGHRICNDCVKACVFQQQTPVDIPRSETRTLRDVLELPWGFEIYGLLTRWNPLSLRRPLPAAPTGRKVLIAGMGPAGFTLAHHLLQDGHAVVGIDGLKIEPLDLALSGVLADGSRVGFEPVEDVADLDEPLDERTMAGFGGVAEYGITVRWDKNALKLIRLLLERRATFSLIGGVRFGGAIDVDEAFRLGFDHVALATGAGRPTTLEIPNGLARGVRSASDFLMSLQLTGAAKTDSLANMQLRLPVVVIGGGLTAIDTATESLAYYPVQVEKFLARYEVLVRIEGETAVRAGWSASDSETADEFLAHARAIREERRIAAAEERSPRILELMNGWGGVTVAYRKRLVDSPAYTLNHEEVEKALEEGIRFAECLSPTRIDTDRSGAVSSITLARQVRAEDGRWTSGSEVRWPARAVLVAAGTQPNTVLATEDPANFRLDGRHFEAIDAAGARVTPEHRSSKPAQARVIIARKADGRSVSFFGDLHPSWSGNVVKAMGSAKQGHPLVTAELAARPPACDEPFDTFAARIDELLRATVTRVERLAPRIVEVVVRAPAAARRFRPGQFYRLQNFETLARVVQIDGVPTRLATEGLALTGAWVDADAGLVGMIVLEMGGSSDLCALLEPGEPVVLMGPTGEPTEIVGGETVLLAGGGLGNAVQFSIGAAFRAQGSRVVYFAGYKRAEERCKVTEIEAAADVVVWCCDEAPGFTPTRPQDRSFIGNLVDAMHAYAQGRLGAPEIPLGEVDRIIAIGSDRMMAAVARARRGLLAPWLKPGHKAIGSINSPMQCMLKEICGQCLQLQHDPETGRTRHVFSCARQDQPLDWVDFDGLDQRLRQNSLQERLMASWIGHCIRPGAGSEAKSQGIDLSSE